MYRFLKMPNNKCRAFGASQDQFGKFVKINYMGKQNYGTAIGGYVSLCARFLILALAFCQIWACFYQIKNIESVH